jgi:putative cardiolipin synthase
VDVGILTNSLSSHDLPAVNGHYEPWRDDILATGTKLYELRADAEIKNIVDVPPVTSKFVGLHSKAAVVDRRYSFVGSMNLDPRSANLNTEMGVLVDSPELAEDLAQLILRDMQPENAWQVLMDDDGKLSWVNSEETRDSQPARNAMQNIMNVIFKVVPVEHF